MSNSAEYKIISIRDNPNMLDSMVEYYTSRWKLKKEVWHGLISDCISTENPLPRWYLMLMNERIVGCVGLMADDTAENDFKPTLAGLYVEYDMRGSELGANLFYHASEETKNLGFSKLYLTTHHTGYFEKYGAIYVGDEVYGDSKARSYVVDVTDMPRPCEMKK